MVGRFGFVLLYDGFDPLYVFNASFKVTFGPFHVSSFVRKRLDPKLQHRQVKFFWSLLDG